MNCSKCHGNAEAAAYAIYCPDCDGELWDALDAKEKHDSTYRSQEMALASLRSRIACANRVVEAVEGLPALIRCMRNYLLVRGDIEKNSVCLSAIALKVRADNLETALAALREKEGRL